MATRQTAGYTAVPARPFYNQGESRQTVNAVVSVLSTWNDADVVILARNLPIDTIVSRLTLPAGWTAITAATDYDIGFYKPADADAQGLGDALDADILVDGYDFDAASSTTGVDILGTNVTLAKNSTIGDLLSLTSETYPAGGVHLCMTLNTAGTANGTLDFDIELAMAH